MLQKFFPKGRSLRVIITPPAGFGEVFKWKSTTIIAESVHQIAEAHICLFHHKKANKNVGYLDLSKG